MMTRDVITDRVQKWANERVLAPYILQAKEGKLRNLWEAVLSVSPFELERQDKFVMRRRVDIPGVTPLRMEDKAFPRFNMIATLLPREGFFDVAQDTHLRNAYPDRLVNTMNMVTPTYMHRDFRFTTTEHTKELIGGHDANKEGYDGRGSFVSVLDTGASRVHEQVRGIDFVTVQTGQQADGNGHGTHVATTVGGDRKMNKRLSRRTGKELWAEGIAPQCDMLAIKCLGYIIGTGMRSHIVEALDIALERGSDVINLSLGGPIDYDSPEESVYFDIFERCRENGAIPVSAVGNSGPDGKTVGDPGGLPNTLSVGAWDTIRGHVAPFSSRGPTPWGDAGVDCLAPGVNIMSGVTGQLEWAGTRQKNGYSELQGTSMATPHVSGLVALMRDSKLDLVGEELTLGEIQEMLQRLGKPRNPDAGHGLITWYMWKEWLSTEYGVEV